MGGRWLVHFAGIDDRTRREVHRATLLAAALPPSADDDDDDLWVTDLIGARVVELDGTDRGTCTSVLANPAHDLLELDGGALVPVTFVVSSVDGVVTIDPADGLFECHVGRGARSAVVAGSATGSPSPSSPLAHSRTRVSTATTAARSIGP